MLCLTAAAGAQPQPAGQTVQAAYESADAKLVAGDAQAGLAEFRALERRLAGNPRSANLALARLGVARALAATGDEPAALEAVETALEPGAIDPARLADPYRDAHALRARLRERALDHPGAAGDYRVLAGVAADDAERAAALVGAARASIFTDPDAALRDLAEAERLLAAAPAGDRDNRTVILTLRGRTLLNKGDARAARAVLQEALRLQGGLTTRASFTELELRGDMALAHLRLGNDDDARRLFAYTGSGRGDARMPRPKLVDAPLCGEAGATPADTVVVQFTIAEDGRVTSAQPILSTRGGDTPFAFARSVRGWAFPPAAIARLPNYMRINSRVELSCKNQVARRTELTGLSEQRGAWLTAGGFDNNGTGWSIEETDALIARLADPGISAQQRIGSLFTLGLRWTLGATRRRQYLARLTDELGTTDMPAPVRLSFLLASQGGDVWGVGSERGLAERLAAIGRLPDIAADPQLRTIVRIRQAAALDRTGDHAAAVVVLDAVIADSALDRLDPLRVAALVDLANIHARAGRFDLASAAYDQTGLTAQQCALIDGGPRRIRSNVSASLFPPAAMDYGFEGWTSVEYDIGADGRVDAPRVIASYPPRVFGSAAMQGVGRMEFERTYRPGGDPGCSAASDHFVFVMPQ